MRQDHRVALALQLIDRLDIRRMEGPFDRRHDLRDALIEMRGRGLDLRRPIEIGSRQNRKALAKGNAERRDAGALAGFAENCRYAHDAAPNLRREEHLNFEVRVDIMLDMSITRPPNPFFGPDMPTATIAQLSRRGCVDNPALSLDAYICSLRVYVKKGLEWGIGAV